MNRPGPIIPPEAAPLKTLTVAMAVMCYLACLAIGALILVDRAVDAWTRWTGSREVTVQIGNYLEPESRLKLTRPRHSQTDFRASSPRGP